MAERIRELEESPIPHTPLKEYVKKQTSELWEEEAEMWANDEAIEKLNTQLLQVARIVWTEAAKNTENEGFRTVQPEEIDNAFNELMRSQNLLEEAANEMQNLRWKFLDLAEKSPAIDEMSNHE